MFSATLLANAPVASMHDTDALHSLLLGIDLSTEQASISLSAWPAVKWTSPKSRLLVALNLKGITANELLGAARALE